MAKKASVTVSQVFNGKYDSTKPDHTTENPQHIYRVEKTVNTIQVKIGEYLPPSKITSLIESDVDVTVVPVK